MADVIEIDASTGEVVHRDFTPEEIAQREADFIAAQEAAAAKEAEEAARNAARLSAATKLNALGLDENEIIAIVGL